MGDRVVAPRNAFAMEWPTEFFDLIGCVTVDGSPDDSGVLDGVRRRFQFPEHHSMTDAASNLSRCAQSSRLAATIVGHGDQGFILTGTTDLTTEDPDKRIDIHRIQQAHIALASLTRAVTKLILCGCHTGAGKDGADLLYELATHLMVPVEAPTCFVFPPDVGTRLLSMEPCGSWQHADPGIHPSPIPPPHEYRPDPAQQDIWLRTDDHLSSVPIAQVELVTFIDLSLPRTLAVHEWSRRTQADALRFIGFNRPFAPGGVPLATVTGRFTLRFPLGSHNVEREFRIFNNRLVQDMAYPDTFYPASTQQLVA